MAYGKDGLIDPFNGLNDIKNKLIKCVGNAYKRFSEDALRMLRAIRFSAELGFELTLTTLTCIEMNHAQIQFVSKERIREEFNKILLSNTENVRDLIDTNLMAHIIPNYIELIGFNQNNPYHDMTLLSHTLRSAKSIECELHLKLTMLLHDIGKVKTMTKDSNGISHYYGHADESATMTLDILKDLKYDNDTIYKVTQLIKCHDYTLDGVPSIKKLLNKIGEELLRDLIAVQWADILAQNPAFAKKRLMKLMQVEMALDDILDKKECFSLKDLAINGNDLIELGFKGKQIGYILNELLNQVIEDKDLNDNEILMTRAKCIKIPD
jgi:tRNA nucleotidyltransferase (CCA-adding enzyme)